MAAYGLHRLWLSARLFDRRVRAASEPAQRFVELPLVTVQLPLFNEPHVAERVIAAACALDYPRDRLDIQVLDDSNDDSLARTQACCARMALAGHAISHLHRPARTGFKSGALAAGLTVANGEFIAIFDADFVPPADFLRQTIHHFTDPSVGVVQAEWAHLNRSTSWLTELQAVFLDGHFIVEQAVRSRSGRWFNFNGTAGVWRRTCIDDAGGWQHDTLTEDTDLSYRAQLEGWNFRYLPTLQCPAELPSTMTAFVSQQHRWTKGLIQTAQKLLPRIVRSRAPWKVKLEACLHLTSPLLYLLMFMLSALALPALFVATPFTERPMLAVVSVCTFSLGALGAATFYLVSQRVQRRSSVSLLLRLPLLMALGVGICAVNARAVLEALVGAHSVFVRTPKVGEHGVAQVASTPGVAGLLELLLAGVLGACFWLTFSRPFTLIGAPFLLLCALGYLSVGGLRLFEPLAAQGRAWARVPATALACMVLLFGAVGTSRMARMSEPPGPPPMRIAEAPRQGQLTDVDVNLLGAPWKVAQADDHGAVRSLTTDGQSWTLQVALNETQSEGAIALDLETAAPGRNLFPGPWFAPNRDRPNQRLVFQVEVPQRFVGELQAFAKDSQGRSEYGPMSVLVGSANTGLVTATLTPSTRPPAMGYRDERFDPTSITLIGLKVSAQSDRARGEGYQPFSGFVRVVNVGISDTMAEPEPDLREPQGQPLLTLAREQFSSGSGLDRPWPFGYAFAGPLTQEGAEELARTYSAIAAEGHHFTRVYLGDYRTGLRFDADGLVSGLSPDFADYLDQLTAIANRHGVTVMLSLTDNAMVNGGDPRALALVSEGPASDAFVAKALSPLITSLKGRDVIWDVFNEPENVTYLPLRTVQGYVDRVLAAGRQADPQARFTVVSRSRPEVAYWRGRGLNLYSHNVFTQRSVAESVEAPRELDAPILVTEMAPSLISAENVEALRRAGYQGIGIWGWGTRDRFQRDEAALLLLSRTLRGLAGDERAVPH